MGWMLPDTVPTKSAEMLQEQFLTAAAQSRVPVTIFLVNGIRLHGQIASFDQYGLLLSGATPQFVYKRAISTIVSIAAAP
jgi:host factor-I protein